MMERRFFRMELIGFAVSLGLGVLLHFLYEWSGYNPAVALFTPVNESIWEHGKLYTVPFLLWAIVEAIVVRPPLRMLVAAKTAALYVMVFGTFGFYYLYTAILGRNVDWINIATYVLFLAIGFILSWKWMNSPRFAGLGVPAVFLLSLLIMLQVNLTLDPPRWDLFRDPMTGTYGIQEAIPGSTIPV